MIKLWSTIPIGTWSGSLLKEYSDPSRIVYSHQDYVDLVGSSGERISHDYSDQSTLEDSKMMAFFDSLIQREIEGWASSEDAQTTDSDSEFENNHSKLMQRIYRGRSKYEESKKHKSNKIAMLISKKRYRLARMAYKKSNSSVQKIKQREKRKRTLLKQKSKDRFNSSHKKSPRKNSAELRKNKLLTPSSRTTRYRTRQSVRQENGNEVLLDVPSTSTGITSSNSRFRVLNEDSESAEEIGVSEQGTVEVNLVNILPTPLNGTHEHVINGLEIQQTNAADPGEPTERANGNVVTIRHSDVNNGASTSRGAPPKRKPLKRQYCAESEDECPSTSNGVKQYSSSSESDFEYDHQCFTPPAKRRTVSQSDSGCGTGPSSTKSSRFLQKYIKFQSRNLQDNGHSSDDERNNERFRKRVRKARANLRNRVCADSDSN